MISRSFGYTPNPIDDRDFTSERFRSSLGGLMLKPWDMLEHRTKRILQHEASSCVAASLKRVIRIWLLAHGYTLTEDDDPSMFYMYANARLEEFAQLGIKPEDMPRLSDIGCIPRLALQAIRGTPGETEGLGFCRERDWPFDMSKVNELPHPVCYRRAVDQGGLEYYSVRSQGRGLDCYAECLSLVKQGGVLVFGMPVDGAYLNHRGEEPVRAIDKSDARGKHMQALYAFEEGTGFPLVDNHWSGWGIQPDVDPLLPLTYETRTSGMVRFTPELLGSGIISDLTVIKAAPVFLETT